jgi:formylglycine-generating enzyme required for sulfatase activity
MNPPKWAVTIILWLAAFNSQAAAVAPGASTSVSPVENAIGMRLVRIEPAAFIMGSPSDEPGRSDGERSHVVTITQPFYIGVYEVTQAEYESVMGKNPSKEKGPRLPVDHISWLDAVAFCETLTARDPRFSYRLPTEAEWEFACRAGTRTRFYWGDDADLTQIGQFAFYKANAGGKTHEVGQKLSNAWGLYDMNGNVWEWCQDWMAPYGPGAIVDPKGPESGEQKVCRGGCWAYEANRCRSAERNEAPADSVHVNLGMRVVAVPK